MARKPAKQVREVTVKDYVFVTLLSITFVWLLYLNANIFRKEEIARSATHDTQQELSTLQGRQKTLEANINELSSERGQEETLRETYGVAKPGEGVIVIVPPKAASTTPTVSFWQKWFGWLKFW